MRWRPEATDRLAVFVAGQTLALLALGATAAALVGVGPVGDARFLRAAPSSRPPGGCCPPSRSRRW